MVASTFHFDRLNDSDLEQTAERIVNLANDNITVLKTDYGVLRTDVTALDSARTAFASAKTAPREAAAARKVQTASLAQLIASARSIFRNEIDKMVTKFRKTNPDFYNGYFAARVIVNRAATHAAPATLKGGVFHDAEHIVAGPITPSKPPAPPSP